MEQETSSCPCVKYTQGEVGPFQMGSDPAGAALEVGHCHLISFLSQYSIDCPLSLMIADFS